MAVSAPVTAEGHRVALPTPGGRIWLAPPNPGSAKPQICIDEPGRLPAGTCSEVTADPSSGVVFSYGTQYPGRVLELVVTNRAVSRVTGAVDGKPVPVSILDLGHGYSALQADFDIRGKTRFTLFVTAYLGDWEVVSYGFSTNDLATN